MNKNPEWKNLILIIMIFVSACIETDIYLPAFPDMMIFFSASESSIQSILSWNFLGICISGPLYGPLSDAFGRKKPLVIALSLFLIGSLITLFSQNLDQMLWGRVLQGIGSGGCFTLGTAIIFDVFLKERAVVALNNLNMIMPIIMATAPLLGAYLNHTFGFRSNFFAITVSVFISLSMLLFFFDETLPKEKRILFNAKNIFKDFKQAVQSLPFWQLTMVISFIFAAYIAFLSGTAVLFVVEFEMSKKIFPFIQAAILGGWVLGGLLLNRAITRWGILPVKKTGMILCIFGGLIFTLIALVAPRDAYLLTVGMVVYAFGANWIIGLYFPESMEILPHIKGIMASVLTSARLLIAAVVVGFTSSLYNATIYPLVVVVFSTLVGMIPMLVFYEKRSLISNDIKLKNVKE